jgi:hypothetical protein
MNRDHDMIPVVGFAGMFYCARCGATPGTYSYLQPCPIAEEGVKSYPANKVQISICGNLLDGYNEEISTSKSDPIGDAVRESSFDRMDRIFKNK